MKSIIAASIALTLTLPAWAEPAPADVARCKSLEEQITRIEEQQRRPLSGQEQDRLQAQKKQLRDEQFRLKC